MFSLSLRLLFWGVARFPGFLSDPFFLRQNTCFLRQYPVLPRFLHTLPRMVHSGGGVPVWLGGVCSLVCGFTRACGLTFQPRFPIPDPSPAPVPAGDWVAELRGSSASRTSQRRLLCVFLPTPVLAKGVLPPVLEKGVLPLSLPLLNSI